MKNIKYGVGFGPALLSRRVGALRIAARELIRMIRGGYDPRRIGILPVERCPVCKYRPNPICRGCNGFNYVVAGEPTKARAAAAPAGNRDAMPRTHVYFMSRPTTTIDQLRTWMFKRDGDISHLIRVVPIGPGSVNFTCDCTAGKAGAVCEHITTIAPIDGRRFKVKETEDNAKNN